MSRSFGVRSFGEKELRRSGVPGLGFRFQGV